jgi:hypothetical protein
MTLGQLIETLEKVADKSQAVKLGFGRPHSYRGYYDQLAFEPKENVTVAEMLKDAKESLGETFMGYKGGYFTMDKYTDVWLANYGSCGEGIGPVLLSLMIGQDLR